MRHFIKALLGSMLLLVLSCNGRGDLRRPLERTGQPTITLWYGANQVAGEPGNSQRWVNILGNISNARQVATLAYSLNGGPAQAVAIGPSTTPPDGPGPCDPLVGQLTLWDRVVRLWSDCRAQPATLRCIGGHAWDRIRMLLLSEKRPSYPRRLYGIGDFNIEIDKHDLRQGVNRVELTATGAGKTRLSTASVTINYTGGRTWPLPFMVDWSRVGKITDEVRIVDGKWAKTSRGLRTMSMGYDRVFVIGDLDWTDYEITVPITIHAIDPAAYNPVSTAPAIGLIFHWRGHTYSPAPSCACAQPRCGWLPWGAYGMYDFGERRFMIDGNKATTAKGPVRAIQFNTTWIWKMCVTNLPNGRSYYRLKVWKQGAPEPARWDLKGLGEADSLPSGSIAFDAHHVDATFGNISIAPGPFKKTDAIESAGREAVPDRGEISSAQAPGMRE